MKPQGTTCWPHFPGVIAQLEEYASSSKVCTQAGGCSFCDGPKVVHEATIFGRTERFYDYDDAVRWCVNQKARAVKPASTRPLFDFTELALGGR